MNMLREYIMIQVVCPVQVSKKLFKFKKKACKIPVCISSGKYTR